MSQEARTTVVWPSAEGWNHEAGLLRLRRRGWRPRCVYDIGASSGVWTATAARIFPLAEFHVFEPLVEVVPGYKESLGELVRRPGGRINVHSIALDDIAGTHRIGIAEHPMGSSMLVTEANRWFPEVVDVTAATLDAYAKEFELPPPDLVKIDTQGAELRILKGGQRTIGRADLLVIETWLERAYGPATPLHHEIVSWLADREFFVADTVGEYRDGERLVSVDVLFARADADIDRKM